MLVNRWLTSERRSAIRACHGGLKGAITGSRCLFDHVVGPGEESRRQFEAERLGSPQVDHKIGTGGLVKGNFCRSGAFQNLHNLAGRSGERRAVRLRRRQWPAGYQDAIAM